MAAISNKTDIKTRSMVVDVEHPINKDRETPHMGLVHNVFLEDGVPLAVARLDASHITHVAATCTDTANPGYDHFIAKQLGQGPALERALLHGAGCGGGLAVLRTAASLAMGRPGREKPARILCPALEVVSTLARQQIDSVVRNGEVKIRAALSADGAGTVGLSNGVGPQAEPIHL